MSNEINTSIYEERKSDYALSRLSPSTPYIKNNIKLPKKFEWKIQNTTYQNGGSCTAYAAEFAERTIETKQYNRYIELSPGFIYYLRASDSEGMNVSSGTVIPPSSMDVTYYQDINKVITELKNAILAQGGNV